MDIIYWIIIGLVGVTATAAAVAISLVILVTLGELAVLAYRGIFKRSQPHRAEASATA